ncbi:MAG: hypothetical protein A2428_06940 [Bdellovibrionales bacterium RIFOXYC1_FULL_54_43]|nr:MAG: hypothetical protein A2428_06940 [Bdellovibrionales bacterium RIFOXYC1_FULL_54_43]OFZ81168.1 MAG: hypothetical protein A2603_06905 [Bdellovibrionales bacterium RIFOXYD1_FULL_55_31]
MGEQSLKGNPNDIGLVFYNSQVSLLFGVRLITQRQRTPIPKSPLCSTEKSGCNSLACLPALELRKIRN